MEKVQKNQLKYLRKQAGRNSEQIKNDERILGMLQCFHFFRDLWISDSSDKITMPRNVYNEVKDGINRIYEKLFK